MKNEISAGGKSSDKTKMNPRANNGKAEKQLDLHHRASKRPNIEGRLKDKVSSKETLESSHFVPKHYPSPKLVQDLRAKCAVSELESIRQLQAWVSS